MAGENHASATCSGACADSELEISGTTSTLTLSLTFDTTSHIRQHALCDDWTLNITSFLIRTLTVRPENFYVLSGQRKKCKKFVAFSLKPTRFGDRALPPLDGHT